MQMNSPNMTILPSMMLSPSSNISSPIEAYNQFQAQCDWPGGRTAVTYTFAYIFFIIYSIGVPLQLCILPANARLAKHRSAFLLLLYINVLDLFWLLEYIWLCVEFIAGKRLVVPWNAEAYLFRIINFCIDALYIELALNRCMAVLDHRGHLFERLFNQTNSRIYIVVVLCGSVVYSIYTNWLPERRPFHCLRELSYFEPTTSIPSNLLAMLPDTGLYDWIQHIYMAAIFMPVLLYTAVFTKLLVKFVHRKLMTHTNTHSGASVLPAASLPYSSHQSHLANAQHQLNKQHQQFANFALERSRLFLLCFFSQLPYLLANGFHLYRTSKIDESMEMIAIFWQFFGTIFHVQQPILMLILSKDMRRGVREDFQRLMVAVKESMPF